MNMRNAFGLSLVLLNLVLPLSSQAAPTVPAPQAASAASATPVAAQAVHRGTQRGEDMARCRQEAEDQGLKGVAYRVAVGRCMNPDAKLRP